jgi:hypothetical protein
LNLLSLMISSRMVALFVQLLKGLDIEKNCSTICHRTERPWQMIKSVISLINDIIKISRSEIGWLTEKLTK